MPELLDASAEANAQTPRTNAAGRLLAVLDAFGPRNRALSLSEISRRSGLSLSTAHRLVHELVSWGALERDPNGCYSIGVRLLELAALAPRGLDLREAAFPCLDQLHHRTRGNVHLGVRDGMEVVYVEAIRACATHPTNGKAGDRWPLHATGTGLVLLAFADRELQEAAMRRPLERYTRLTVTDPAQLRRKLAQVRQSGYAVAVGQITLPDLVVAVPVHDPFGGLAAAISVVVEAARARPQALARMLTDASTEITRRLATQSEQPLASRAHRHTGFAPVAPATSGRVSAPV
ncbi:MAG TPA: IclR family transcriptional regulator [Streptosporangiaceae bacterium]|jgi:DNA-binding IclR family transcriptional regulator|nr:IclR family transcriptional regulator [Streptosporangiaceae bacterium]